MPIPHPVSRCHTPLFCTRSCVLINIHIQRYFTRLNADYLWLAMFILRLTSTQTNWYVMSFLSPALMYNWTLPANHSSWWTHSAQADSRNVNIENLINCTKKRRCNLQNNCNQICWAANFSLLALFTIFGRDPLCAWGLKARTRSSHHLNWVLVNS